MRPVIVFTKRSRPEIEQLRTAPTFTSTPTRSCELGPPGYPAALELLGGVAGRIVPRA